MLSGPLALCGLMLLSSLWMPGVVMVSDGITLLFLNLIHYFSNITSDWLHTI
jgi:hypothetical protein